MCAEFRFSISSNSDDIVAEVKGGNFMPPPAAGGWRGGPAAAGLTGHTMTPGGRGDGVSPDGGRAAPTVPIPNTKLAH